MCNENVESVPKEKQNKKDTHFNHYLLNCRREKKKGLDNRLHIEILTDFEIFNTSTQF